MWEIISNPITVSVAVMCILCLLKVNVILSLIAAALIAGFVAGMGPSEIMTIFVGNLGGNGENALSYVLLGAFAAGLAYVGIADILSKHLESVIKGKKYTLLAILVICACISGTIIPVHIAFIPILVPPMLALMNEMKLDRRASACALAFGLKAPYITIPIGYGLIFHGIIAANMTDNGMPIDILDIWKSNWILGIGMLSGLFLSCIYYGRKQRIYEEVEIESLSSKKESTDMKLNRSQIVSLIAIVATVVCQLKFSSMPFGAIAGLTVMIVGGAIPLKKIDEIMGEGIKLMGIIAIVMLVASGYAAVVKQCGAVEALVNAAIAVLGGNKAIAAFIMILIGLITTMGIGTSFGTVPILAVLYVPMCQQLGFSPASTVVLIAAAAALGDAGSPASDTTLGPSAGLNADGQHDHIWDTCVPTFIFYNIPLVIFGFIGAMLM